MIGKVLRILREASLRSDYANEKALERDVAAHLRNGLGPGWTVTPQRNGAMKGQGVPIFLVGCLWPDIHVDTPQHKRIAIELKWLNSRKSGPAIATAIGQAILYRAIHPYSIAFLARGPGARHVRIGEIEQLFPWHLLARKRVHVVLRDTAPETGGGADPVAPRRPPAAGVSGTRKPPAPPTYAGGAAGGPPAGDGGPPNLAVVAEFIRERDEEGHMGYRRIRFTTLAESERAAVLRLLGARAVGRSYQIIQNNEKQILLRVFPAGTEMLADFRATLSGGVVKTACRINRRRPNNALDVICVEWRR